MSLRNENTNKCVMHVKIVIFVLAIKDAEQDTFVTNFAFALELVLFCEDSWVLVPASGHIIDCSVGNKTVKSMVTNPRVSSSRVRLSKKERLTIK